MKNTAKVAKRCVDVDGNVRVVDFGFWPIDLLSDYILKIYHRNIRRDGPIIMAQLDKVCSKYGESHPSLLEVKELFEISLMDLEHHLQKEEQVLFPYIYALDEAKRSGSPKPMFHCGSIANPIEVMKMEHDAEKARYKHIDDLTGGYSAPEDADDDYVEMLSNLSDFNASLLEHIYLENNVLFPEAIALSDNF